MGKMKLPKMPHPKTKKGGCLLVVLGTIALIAFAAAAWEFLLVCALWAAAIWLTVKICRWLDRHLHITAKVRALGNKLRGLRKPLKILLFVMLSVLAVIFFLESFDTACACTVLIAGVWLAATLWKKIKSRADGLRKGKFRLQDLSIQNTYVLYVVVSMVAATVVCGLMINSADRWRTEMQVRYADQRLEYRVPSGGSVDMEGDEYGTEVYQFTILDAEKRPVDQFYVDMNEFQVQYVYEPDQEDEESSEVEWYEHYNTVYILPSYSDSDQWMDLFLRVLSVVCIPVVYVSAIVICAMLFYRKKLRQPIDILTDAAGRIAGNSLDFKVSYEPRDEMGRLCDSFEQMRAALQQNNAEMWRQMEERRRLNAAFSHDLRTPLTVLKGHADLLRSEIPDESIERGEILQEVQAMSNHIGRLENYVSAMSRLQRLEDLEIHPAPVPAAGFARELREMAAILCGDKAMGFAASPAVSWNIDAEVVMQVFENLLSNAVRYAQTRVTIRLEERMNVLELCVTDDGPGFSSNDLQKATEPFYRAEGSGEGHLGLGLNICRVLCERHGGGVSVENAEEGGGRVRAWFALVRK